MSTTENGESMVEALVEQPGGWAADGVKETEEQRLQEVERQRLEKEKEEEAFRKRREELERSEEATRKLKAERTEANKRLLDAARATKAGRRANVSAKELTSGSPNAGRTASEVQRIREAMERGYDFLSTDQEMRIREAAAGLPEVPEALIHSADCRAKQLCQENTSVELTLIVTMIEEIVQSLIRELIKVKKRNYAAMNEGENQLKDSVSVSVTSIDTSIDQSTSSRTSVQFKHPPPPVDAHSGTQPQKSIRRTGTLQK
jgi:hypothetical protein